MTTTWFGILIGGFLLIVSGIALNTSELFILGVVAVAVSGYAVVFTRRRISLGVQRDVSPLRVTRGDPAVEIVSFTNTDSLPSPGLVGHRHDSADHNEFFVAPIPPRGSRTSEFPLRTDRRGVYTLAPLRLMRTDPLRLAGTSRSYGTATRFYVHPRVTEIGVATAASIRDAEGIRSDSFQGSESFHALREYVQGDDHRLIHWKSSARTGELVVKQFVDLWSAEVLIVLDTRGHCYSDESFEEAVEATASLAVASAEARFGVMTMLGTGTTATIGGTSRHHHELLDHLAGAQSGAGDDLLTIARRITAKQSRGQHVRRALVLVTGTAEADEVLSFITSVRSFERRLVVRMISSLEQSPFVEVSSNGDEAVSAENAADLAAGWKRLMQW